MRKMLCFIAAMGSMVYGTYAQEEGKFRLGLDAGYAIPANGGGGGVLVALEPKYNIADNINIGIRLEGAAMAKEIEENEFSTEADVALNIAALGTFDYYFNTPNSSFAPFVGAGLGYYGLANLEVEDNDITDETTIERDNEIDDRFGGLVRAGFELGKLRFAATYNIVGNSDIGEGAEVKNSYFGISLGFYAGGGKWKR